MAAAETLEPIDRQQALRNRVSTLCHLIRWAAVAWIIWVLGLIVTTWSDVDQLKRSWGSMLNLDLTALPSAHYAAAFATILIDWSIAGVVVIFVWRLFGCYLRGSIFSGEAVDEMRCLGWAGLAAVSADIVVRPILQWLFSMHLDVGPQLAGFWLEPNDALHILMALFVVALAHIFRTGVEIADDNRQII